MLVSCIQRMAPRTLTRERLTRYGLPLLACVGLTLLRTHDIARTFWLFGDQILYWDSALLPFSQQPLAGPEQHVGGYALGPTYYYLVWLSRVVVGPFYDNLPHAGAIAQVVLHSALDALLLFAIWRKSGSVSLAAAALVLITTAPYDLALSATLWNPSLASAVVKGATALVLLGWPERSLVGVGVVAGLAWVSLHFHVPAVFCVASLLAALVVIPLRDREYRSAGLRTGVIAGVVLFLQLPYLAHRLMSGPGEEAGGAVISGSLAQVLFGGAPLRVVDSAAGLAQAVERIQADPWQAAWLGWALAVCTVIVLVRYRRDPTLLAVTVLPLLVSVAGYALWVGTFDEYYYLPQMTAAVLTMLLGITALAGPYRHYVGVAALVLAVAIVPARVRRAATIHKMPGYDLLVEGSKAILNRGVSVRAIKADFLPPGADPEYLYTVLGGRLNRNGEWVARIADDGLVFYDQTNPR